MLRVVRGSLSSIISILTVPSCVELLYLREFQFLKFIHLGMWFVTYLYNLTKDPDLTEWSLHQNRNYVCYVMIILRVRTVLKKTSEIAHV